MGDLVEGKFPNAKAGAPEGVASGSGGPHDPGMEARVAKLESDIEYVKRDVAELRTDMRAVRSTMASVDTRLAVIEERMTHCPTTASLWKAVAVSAGTVIAALWLIVQFLAKPWVEELIKSVHR